MKTNNPASHKATDAAGFDDPQFINPLRQDMLKFAALQLRNEELAEDAVQEALIAAHQNAAAFARKAAYKTWVFAILKNKIADILRKGKKELTASQLVNENAADISDVLFDQRGFWHKEESPAAWSSPMEFVKNAHFWRVFETCLHGLPANLAQVFMMREFIELDSEEICQTLGISTSNLHVILYRARIRLRECLENNWIKEGSR